MKTKTTCLKWLGENGLALLACAVFAMSMFPGGMANAEVDINKLIEETQQMADGADEMELIWWIPTEFWEVSMGQDPTVSPAQIDEILSVLSPYTIVMAVDGTLGTFGGVTYETEKSIRKSIRLVDSNGTKFAPLKDSEVDADTKNFLAMMGPIVASMLGEMGENMHFLVFPAKNKQGEIIADATGNTAFTITLGDNDYDWRLPLGSLLDPKTCPNDGERMSGAWSFCPWHGLTLDERADG